MYSYFYNFHKEPLGFGLFSSGDSSLTPNFGEQFIVTENLEQIITEDGSRLITE